MNDSLYQEYRSAQIERDSAWKKYNSVRLRSTKAEMLEFEARLMRETGDSQ